MKFFNTFALTSKILFGFIAFGSFGLSAHAAANNDPNDLVFAIDIIRHGDRTPASAIPTAPYNWPQGLGQLTPLGMKEEHALGKKLHDRYIKSLLPDHYQAGTMYVRSSDFDRTLMSAQCVALGLYPDGTGPRVDEDSTDALPRAFQPIPIHTVPLTQEGLLIPDLQNNSAGTSNPPSSTDDTALSYNYNDLLVKYVFCTPEWKAKEASLQPHFEAWSKATGISIGTDPSTDGLYQLKSLSDALSIRRDNNVPQPAGLSEEDVTTIIDAGHWAFTTIFKNPTIGKITGGALLQKIIGYFNDAVQNPAAQDASTPSLKYVLFSAHDSTILMELDAMGMPQNEVPPYSSDLNIGLHSSANGYYVTVTYNDQPMTFPCTGTTTCSLEQFRASYGQSN